MDWYTILLIFIFFILPLIQKIAESRREGPPLSGPDETNAEPQPVPRRRPRLPVPETGPAGERESWSDDWGRWPSERSDEEAREESAPVLSRPKAESLPSMVVPPPPPAEARSREVVLPRPLPTLSPAVPAVVEFPRVRPARKIARIAAPPMPVARMLRGNAAELDLKRAIVLSEILSPPRALRPLGHEPQE